MDNKYNNIQLAIQYHYHVSSVAFQSHYGDYNTKLETLKDILAVRFIKTGPSNFIDPSNNTAFRLTVHVETYDIIPSVDLQSLAYGCLHQHTHSPTLEAIMCWLRNTITLEDLAFALNLLVDRLKTDHMKHAAEMLTMEHVLKLVQSEHRDSLASLDFRLTPTTNIHECRLKVEPCLDAIEAGYLDLDGNVDISSIYSYYFNLQLKKNHE